MLLYSKYLNTLLLLSLSFFVYLEQLTIPILCVYAFLIGLASAFGIPAGSAILPGVVARQKLESANALFFMMLRLSMFIGPIVAGIILKGEPVLGGNISAGVSTTNALALLFLLDAISFAFSDMFKLPYIPGCKNHPPEKCWDG